MNLLENTTQLKLILKISIIVKRSETEVSLLMFKNQIALTGDILIKETRLDQSTIKDNVDLAGLSQLLKWLIVD